MFCLSGYGQEYTELEDYKSEFYAITNINDSLAFHETESGIRLFNNGGKLVKTVYHKKAIGYCEKCNHYDYLFMSISGDIACVSKNGVLRKHTVNDFEPKSIYYSTEAELYRITNAKNEVLIYNPESDVLSFFSKEGFRLYDFSKTLIGWYSEEIESTIIEDYNSNELIKLSNLVNSRYISIDIYGDYVVKSNTETTLQGYYYTLMKSNGEIVAKITDDIRYFPRHDLLFVKPEIGGIEVFGNKGFIKSFVAESYSLSRLESANWFSLYNSESKITSIYSFLDFDLIKQGYFNRVTEINRNSSFITKRNGVSREFEGHLLRLNEYSFPNELINGDNFEKIRDLGTGSITFFGNETIRLTKNTLTEFFDLKTNESVKVSNPYINTEIQPYFFYDTKVFGSYNKRNDKRYYFNSEGKCILETSNSPGIYCIDNKGNQTPLDAIMAPTNQNLILRDNHLLNLVDDSKDWKEYYIMNMQRDTIVFSEKPIYEIDRDKTYIVYLEGSYKRIDLNSNTIQPFNGDLKEIDKHYNLMATLCEANPYSFPINNPSRAKRPCSDDEIAEYVDRYNVDLAQKNSMECNAFLEDRMLKEYRECSNRIFHNYILCLQGIKRDDDLEDYKITLVNTDLYIDRCGEIEKVEVLDENYKRYKNIIEEVFSKNESTLIITPFLSPNGVVKSKFNYDLPILERK